MLLLFLALLMAKTDSTQLAAFSSVALAGAALVKSITIDPRASRLSERKENVELREKVDELYREKRAAEDREREALRRLDRAERRAEDQDLELIRLRGEIENYIDLTRRLEGDVRKWRMIAGDIRGQG
jgi:hypothetical protein